MAKQNTATFFLSSSSTPHPPCSGIHRLEEKASDETESEGKVSSSDCDSLPLAAVGD